MHYIIPDLKKHEESTSKKRACAYRLVPGRRELTVPLQLDNSDHRSSFSSSFFSGLNVDRIDSIDDPNQLCVSRQHEARKIQAPSGLSRKEPGGAQSKVALKLIYVHGFQGDHTSFQAFPTDLHENLRLRLPSEIVLESCLYPTYKSRRPISEAAKKFIDWLGTQPAGPVILLGHSMGGLLAAEVATSDSHQSKRVIGLMAFDVPFLGMHPRVIISGIASLLPGDKESREKSEAELNDENVVKRIRGDDVDNNSDDSLDSTNTTTSLSPPLRPPLSHSSSSSFSSKVNDEWEAMKMNLPVPNSRSQNNLSPYEFSSSPSARSSPTSLVSFTSSLGSHTLSGSAIHKSSFTAKLERAAERIVQWQNPDAPFLRWLRKHADDPLSAMTNWVVEHFQFGACMFDPVGLHERYKTLESWNGKWTNIWTEVPARETDRSTGSNDKYVEEGSKDATGALPSNTADIFHFADMDEYASESDARTRAKARKAAEKTIRKEREKERKQGTSSARPARHFIVLPDVKYARTESLRFGSLEHWERFPILNVDDEVEAHCGLFIRSCNPRYENLVERVADVMEEWCKSAQLSSVVMN
ncbi:hypothetical protein ACEPAI_8534 [Sanghuangporus weigelae]